MPTVYLDCFLLGFVRQTEVFYNMVYQAKCTLDSLNDDADIKNILKMNRDEYVFLKTRDI